MNRLITVTTYFIAIYIFVIITPSNQLTVENEKNFVNNSGSENFIRASSQTKTISDESVTYIRAAIPLQIYQCTKKLNLLRCMKLFMLQRMATNHGNYPNSGNVTTDFLQQIFDGRNEHPSLLDKRYRKIDDKQLNSMLIECFQKFFRNREIKLHFIPGVMVRVVPSNENKIKLSVREAGRSQVIIDREARKHNNNKPYKQMMQIAIPAMIMPAVLLGTVLPFLLPALKMATIMSIILNNGAFLGALMYAAKTASGSSEEHMVHFTHPGYH